MSIETNEIPIKALRAIPVAAVDGIESAGVQAGLGRKSREPHTVSTSDRLSTRSLIAFALPTIPAAMMFAPVGNILPAFYAKNTLISLSVIGAVLAITRISDAITDQIIGYLSDITQSPIGRRKPWLIAGMFVSMISGYVLFTPSSSAGPEYLFWSLFFMYLGWTMIMVPLQAWTSELSRDYRERSRISTFIAMAGPIGGIAVFAIPLLPIFQTSEITFEALRFMAIVFVIALPICILSAVVVVPQGRPVSDGRPKIKETVRAISKNKPFWSFLVLLTIGAIALGMVQVPLLLFFDNYAGLGDKIPHLFIAGMVVGLLSLPVWLTIMQRIGKHRAMALGGVLNLVALPFLWMIEPGNFLGCLAWMMYFGFSGAAMNVAPIAILGDIVDYDILKTGVNRAGNYFAFLGLIQKSVSAVGGALAFFLLDSLGFDPTSGTVEVSGKFALLFTITVIPGFLTVISIWILMLFPITARRHGIIQRRLEQRVRRQS